ncbi:MAG TPA: sodium ion-translocating decarboxylase subunit beta [Candidatus Binatia bacterium]|jgi:oxaloacetate decarboxylase beta subunit|nr:sodium ion-translocating decarboxylase subunit beta [Candidatus Binatia bacterium]
MESALVSGLQGLFLGVLSLRPEHVIMIVIGSVLLYLGIKKGYEPLLLVPIGFGAILVNIPLAEMMGKDGFLRFFYDVGVLTEVFPLLIFIGIGAMTDFQPLLENPKIILLGAAGQFGIFLTLLLALAVGFDKLDAVAVAIIGACDGPTAIYVSSKFAPHMLGAVSVAAYSYMSLVPLIQPPIMRALTTQKERTIVMGAIRQPVSKTTKIVFPIVVTIFASILAPKGAPLIGTVMLGNLMKESGVVDRLKSASENEIANMVTLLLGLCIGATMEADKFLLRQTLLVLALGFIAICLDTAVGVLFGKLMCFLTGGKINPLIGAAGISAFPMSARVVQVEGQKYNKKSYLLMHAMSANAGGQIGSVIAAAVMLSVLQGMGIVGG